MAEPILIAIIIIIALIFDFGNGMNDSANSISTIVATKVMRPKMAAVMAAFFNFIGPFAFGVSVAATIAKGLVVPAAINEFVILAGLVGTIAWVYMATYYGIPISASHALIGGFVGAAFAAGGSSSIIFAGVATVILFIFLSPVLGMIAAYTLSLMLNWILKNSSPARVDRNFRRLQIVSAAAYSLGHGTNDAQKTMGLIAALLFSTGMLGKDFYVPLWVIFISAFAISLGTFIGGWRVVRTLGMRLTRLRPYQGFCAEAAGASMLFATAHFGIPVSTTHTIAGGIMGVGLAKRRHAVRWGIARNILYAWLITIPFSAAVAMAFYYFISLLM